MSSATLYRWSGISLVLGALFLTLGAIARVAAGDDVASALNVLGWFMGAPGAALVIFGLAGVYARHTGTMGLMGLLGFIGITLFLLIFGIFGSLLHTLVLPVVAAKDPMLAQNAPMSVGLAYMMGALCGAAGSVLLGIALLRTDVGARAAAALIIVGGIVMLGHGLPLYLENVGLVLLCAGLAWLGLTAAATQPMQTGPTPGMPGSTAQV